MIEKKDNENIYVDGYRDKFQDPAMDRWVTTDSLNSTCDMLREVNDRINNKMSIVTSTILGIFSAYFLSIKDWTLMILMLIILEVWIIFQIKKHINLRKELLQLKEKIIKVCEEHRIKVPRGD